MNLTESETELINKLRKLQANNTLDEHTILLRYIPTDFEGGFIQQILPGSAQSILQLRTTMKKLLDDLQELQLSNSFFTIIYEPYGIQLFKH